MRVSEPLFFLPELKLKIIQCRIPGLWNRGSVLYQAKIFTSILLLSQGWDNRHCKALGGINLRFRDSNGVFIFHFVFPLLNKVLHEFKADIWPFLMQTRPNEAARRCFAVGFFCVFKWQERLERTSKWFDFAFSKWRMFLRDSCDCALQCLDAVLRVG